VTGRTHDNKPQDITIMSIGSYLRLTGGFGDVRVGSVDGVTNNLATSAPATGVTGPNDGDFANAIIHPANVSVTADTLLGGSKTVKLVYYYPEISGFYVGASYEPSSATTNSVPAVGGNAQARIPRNAMPASPIAATSAGLVSLRMYPMRKNTELPRTPTKAGRAVSMSAPVGSPLGAPTRILVP